MRRLIAVLAVLFMAGCGGSGSDEAASSTAPTTEASDAPAAEPSSVDVATTTEAPSTTAAPTTTAPVAEPLTMTGDGEIATAPFDVEPGAYLITYSFTSDCYYSASLKATDGSALKTEDVGSGSGPVDGETNIYGVEGGSYYLDVITGPAPGCPWTVTFVPQT